MNVHTCSQYESVEDVACIVVVYLNVSVERCTDWCTHNIGAGVVSSNVGRRGRLHANVRDGTQGP